MGDIDINKYNKYTNDFTAIFDTYEEIIYICNKFDINRINRFLIYTIENYDYYLPARGYSDTANRDDIIKSSEYTEITVDIQKNFDLILSKCKELSTKIDTFVREYLENLRDTEKKLIVDNFKSQFNRINTNLKNLVIELEKIKAKDDSEIDSDISFNIYPITKSGMMLKMYSTAKMIFKNLHIINSDESEPTAEDLEAFNTNLNNINKELIKKFNTDIIVKNQKVFQDQIKLLNEAQAQLENKFKGLKDEEKEKEKEKERKGKEGEDEEDEDEGDGEDGGGKVGNETLLTQNAEDAQKALESAQKNGGNDINTARKNVELAQDALKKAEAKMKAAEEERKKKEEEAAAAEEKRKKKEEAAAVNKVAPAPISPIPPAPIPPPTVVANATKSSFKYSFETLTNNVDNNTPIYNNKDKPYYLDANKTPAKFMASLNAGDNLLYVGGAQINRAFNNAIAGKNEGDKGDDDVLRALSIEMHKTFYTVVNSTNEILGKIYKYDDLQSKHSSNIYFVDMYLYKSEKLLDKFKFANNIYPGDVFIEILKDNSWINGGGDHINNMTNKANKAMIYCVGPQGDVFKNTKNTEDVEEEFLKAILIVGKNIANAINEYNKYDGNDNKKIDYVRICLISGNQYLPTSMKSDKLTESQVKVAEALIKGIHSVNKEKGVKDIVYNFAYADNAFQIAFDKLKKIDEYTNDPTFVKLNIT